VGEAKSGTRVSLDGAVKESPVKRPAFAPEAVVIGGGRGQEIDEAGLTHTFTKSEGTLTDVLQAKLKSFFDKMDLDSNGEVSKEEAEKFWGKNFAKLNAQSMFNGVSRARPTPPLPASRRAAHQTARRALHLSSRNDASAPRHRRGRRGRKRHHHVGRVPRLLEECGRQWVLARGPRGGGADDDGGRLLGRL
jgi:hypothetical protein